MSTVVEYMCFNCLASDDVFVRQRATKSEFDIIDLIEHRTGQILCSTCQREISEKSGTVCFVWNLSSSINDKDEQKKYTKSLILRQYACIWNCAYMLMNN